MPAHYLAAIEALLRLRPVGDVLLENETALVDQPPAHVPMQVVRGVDAQRLCSQLDDGLRDADLGALGAACDRLDGVAVPVAALEVHGRVGARRVLAQGGLDERDALEERAPVQCIEEAGCS